MNKKIVALILVPGILMSIWTFNFPVSGLNDESSEITVETVPSFSEAYTELAEIIADAEQNVLTKPEGYWEPNSYNYFLEKYKYAKGELNAPSSTDDDYRDAANSLQDGMRQIFRIYSQAFLDLAGVIKNAEDIIYIPGGPEWSDASYERLVSEYEYAKGVLDNLGSTDPDYIDAKEKLAYAIEHLEPYNDKTALWNLTEWVRSSGLLNSADKYTGNTYQAFLDAYSYAAGFEYQSKVPQEKLDEAVDGLNTAIAGLKLMGDVNNDKDINILDVLEIQKHLAGVVYLMPDAIAAADTDSSGTLGINNCLMIQKYIAKMIEGFTA